jgi:non-heme Fe2+,alpha-ketoglutarate-dependent halogenase
MSGSLTEHEVARFSATGHTGPVAALSPKEVAHYRGKLEVFEAEQGQPLTALPGKVRTKTHLLFTWMNELARHPKVLDAVESLIGPDILLYHLTSWLKEPRDGSYVSWHQDSTYFYLEPFEQVTAWIALTDATPENGCLQILPGSHKHGQREHVIGDPRGNLLSNGQHIELSIDEREAIPVVVPSGHVSLHHTHLVHSSGPNETDERRIGIGVSYIPPHVRFVGEGTKSVTLVRGSDPFGYFGRETPPTADFDEAARNHHAEKCMEFFESHGSRNWA